MLFGLLHTHLYSIHSSFYPVMNTTSADLLLPHHSTDSSLYPVIYATCTGFYCDGRAATPCEGGSYCPKGSPLPLPCSTPGSYCGARAELEGRCPSGFYCPESQTKVRCQTQGAYCEEGAASEGGSCAYIPQLEIVGYVLLS